MNNSNFFKLPRINTKFKIERDDMSELSWFSVQEYKQTVSNLKQFLQPKQVVPERRICCQQDKWDVVCLPSVVGEFPH